MVMVRGSDQTAIRAAAGGCAPVSARASAASARDRDLSAQAFALENFAFSWHMERALKRSEHLSAWPLLVWRHW